MSRLDDIYEEVNNIRDAAKEHEGYLRVQAVPILLEAISLQLEVLSYQLQAIASVGTTDQREPAKISLESNPVGSTVKVCEVCGSIIHLGQPYTVWDNTTPTTGLKWQHVKCS